MSALKLDQREAGVLLHPTSLPSGKLDADAIRWLDWLAESGFKVWQVLPLGVPLEGLSPYQCASAFAINPKLFPDITVSQQDFVAWKKRNAPWLEDYALFMTLKQHFDFVEWNHWPEPYKRRDKAALYAFSTLHHAEISAIIQQQYTLWAQWQTLRQAAQERNIRLFGDMPIFVAYDSADVWAHPERFLLDEEGNPTVVTGVPPDYFSATGQRWGNPHYDWPFMKQENFLWWSERLRYHFEFFDLVRLDHFRGLAAVWEIPAHCETATEGAWVEVLGDDLLQYLQHSMQSIPLVAEDLGVITPDVIALRDKYQLPGMSVLQFAFDYFEDNPHKPHNVHENVVYYTGTHDNDTLRSWYESLEGDQQSLVMQALWRAEEPHLPVSTPEALYRLLDMILASRASLVMLPMQDILQLGREARMNVPSTIEGNWIWRFDWQDVPAMLANEFKARLTQHQR